MLKELELAMMLKKEAQELFDEDEVLVEVWVTSVYSWMYKPLKEIGEILEWIDEGEKLGEKIGFKFYLTVNSELTDYRKTVNTGLWTSEYGGFTDEDSVKDLYEFKRLYDENEEALLDLVDKYTEAGMVFANN